MRAPPSSAVAPRPSRRPHQHRLVAAILALGALATGCASTSPQAPFEDVKREVQARSGHKVGWSRGDGDEAKKIERAVDDLLRRDLTADAAVQIALLVNPHLREKLEELAIAQADLVQAGLLKNPVFGIGITAWEQEHISPNLFATVEQDFLDIVTMPLRKRLSATTLESTKLEIGDEILALAAEVRTAYFTAVAAEQVVAVRRLIEEAAQASGELAQRQYDAGNSNDVTLNVELGLAAQATLDRTRAETEAIVAREHLNKAMGTWGPRAAWKTAGKLPELPREEPPLDHLESRAIGERLDVAAARRNAQAMGYALSLAKTTRWTGTVNVAVEAGRLRHSGRFSFGPSVALEIPLFDQRQAQIAKLEAYERKAESELQGLAVDVRADVRASRARVGAARQIVDQYTRTIVPLREKVVRFSQERYDAMLLGVYQLIQARQSEFDAYREAIEALRDYWIARSDLERAVGGRLEKRAPSANTPTAPASSSSRPGGSR